MKPLLHLVNTSLIESTFARKWKFSRITPLLKSPDADRLCTQFVQTCHSTSNCIQTDRMCCPDTVAETLRGEQLTKSKRPRLPQRYEYDDHPGRNIGQYIPRSGGETHDICHDY